MTQTAELRDLTVAALKASNIAGGNVYSVRSWPTTAMSYPVIYVKTPIEDRESLGPNGAPQYKVTSTIRIIARVQVPPQANDAGTAVAEAALESLKAQIEVAVINNPSIMVLLQQFPFTRSEMGINSEGSQAFGELALDIGMEFYQGPEDFYPIVGTPIEELTLDADLTNVTDPSGTYPNPPFPASVTPAPRTSGPDGRAEGGLDIQLPQ
ncbi:hypothetical protein DyAD56_15860 [Dyella sp. AD56]|uniref:phage tail protein n=1 Tax=Dyella sp. AD56 TaxID=1528744 RepID=UPI000C819FE4|nr:phage tail protein [Dyella sp. AD56]PMQ04163.1 hypothetical protein DyAD56_15860 [Dyella sp. AD56]